LQTAGGFNATTVSRDGDLLTIDILDAVGWPVSPILDVRANYSGNFTAALAAANAQSGGGVIYLSAGDDIQMGDRQTIVLNSNVVLRGDGVNVSRLVWAANSGLLTGPLISSTNGPVLIENMGFEVTSAYNKGFLSLAGGAGSVIRNISAQFNTLQPMGNPLYIPSDDVTIIDSYFYVYGNCSTVAGYPLNYMLHSFNANYLVLKAVSWDTNCPGYAVLGGSYFVFEGNTFNSYAGPAEFSVVAGSGFNTLGYTTRRYVICSVAFGVW